MAVIKSISLSAEDDAFCRLNNLSPSGLLKQRIKQIRDFYNTYSKERIENLERLLEKNIKLRDQYFKELEALKEKCSEKKP